MLTSADFCNMSNIAECCEKHPNPETKFKDNVRGGVFLF